MSQVSRAYFWVRQADQKMGPPICIFFWLSKKKFSSDVGVGGSVDEAQLYFIQQEVHSPPSPEIYFPN